MGNTIMEQAWDYANEINYDDIESKVEMVSLATLAFQKGAWAILENPDLEIKNVIMDLHDCLLDTFKQLRFLGGSVPDWDVEAEINNASKTHTKLINLVTTY